MATKKDLIIYEDRLVLAFLDNKPLSRGHFLVTPKKHYEFIEKMPKEEFLVLFSRVQELSARACRLLGADGANIALNNGKVAGQQVDHVHVHVIPRYKGDETKIHVENKSMDEDTSKLAEIHTLLSKNL